MNCPGFDMVTKPDSSEGFVNVSMEKLDMFSQLDKFVRLRLGTMRFLITVLQQADDFGALLERSVAVALNTAGFPVREYIERSLALTWKSFLTLQCFVGESDNSGQFGSRLWFAHSA